MSLNSSVRLLVEAEGAEEVKLLMFVHRSENILLNDFGVLGWHIDESEHIALCIRIVFAVESRVPVVASDKCGS